MISDEMLRTAAANSRARFVAALEQDCAHDAPHEFSPGFERKIKKLSRRADHPNLYRGLQRVASILLAALMGTGVWLSVDTEARAAVIQWVREVYEEHILYRYFNEPENDALPTYEITALPEGYTLTDTIVDETTAIQIFVNGDLGIIFTYYFISPDTQTVFFPEEYQYDSVKIGPYRADYYAPADKIYTNELIWFDEEQGIAFQLSAFVEKEEMIKIANSIVLKK